MEMLWQHKVVCAFIVQFWSHSDFCCRGTSGRVVRFGVKFLLYEPSPLPEFDLLMKFSGVVMTIIALCYCFPADFGVIPTPFFHLALAYGEIII